eukprot:6271014-Pyramimonas_sp.AAC.1
MQAGAVCVVLLPRGCARARGLRRAGLEPELQLQPRGPAGANMPPHRHRLILIPCVLAAGIWRPQPTQLFGTDRGEELAQRTPQEPLSLVRRVLDGDLAT